MVIAIDGFSSCGKSTLARALANELGYTFIDTGAMYRAVTLYLLQNTIDISDFDAVARSLPIITIELCNSDGKDEVLLNGLDVTSDIRSQDVAERVSDVAIIPEVRDWLVAQQRIMGQSKSVVMDGRDIGTVVFPDADLKIFVTASADIRVQRRTDELAKQGRLVTKEEVRANLCKRDRIDSTREHSPLRRADDAYLLDNSLMTREEQLDLALRLVQAKIGK